MINYPITQNIIQGLPKIPFINGHYEGVIAHATADYGATDEQVGSFENRTWQKAFVHFIVDWDSITQKASTDYRCWGAGSKANPKYLSVELCQVKNDGSKSARDKFNASYDRYTWLLARLLYNRKLGVTDEKTLWSHAEVSKILGGTNHTDPIGYLAEWKITWASFVQTVKEKYNIMATPTPVKPTPVIPITPSCVINGKKINGLISNDKLYIPARELSVILNKSIVWDDKSKTATIK